MTDNFHLFSNAVHASFLTIQAGATRRHPAPPGAGHRLERLNT